MSEVWEVAFDQRGSNSKVSELCLLAKGAYYLLGTMSVMHQLDHQVKRRECSSHTEVFNAHK